MWDAVLVRLHFAREAPFRQDLALQVPPLPSLAAARRLAELEPGTPEAQFALNSLTRGRNRVVFGLREAQRIIERTLKSA